MTAVTDVPVKKPLTPLEWLICAVACVGFAFDTYELLMMPIIVRPALLALTTARPGTVEFNSWVGALFSVPAIAGGLFGLLGGYLTDRFGRRRVLVWSILLYSFSALACGYASSLWMLLVLRCGTSIGVCVEFVAAVAWLAELFPDADRRERVLGYTQAFSSAGGSLIALVYYVIVTYAEVLPAIHGTHDPWRYTLMSGMIPAIPLILVRPFLPESPIWQQKKSTGTLKRPSLFELFRPRFRTTTIVTTAMVALAYAATYGAMLQTPRIVPGLAEVRAMSKMLQEQTIGTVQMLQEMGGLAGRVLLAVLAVRIVSRRRVVRTFLVPGLVIVPLVFFFGSTHSLAIVKIGTFVGGMLVVGQFSFWGNYLPRVYPTHLRGTGEAFASNIGGRMIGNSAAAVTAGMSTFMPGDGPATQLAYACGIVGITTFAVGLVLTRWLPEPREEMLTE